MALDANDALTQLVIFIGVVLGSAGATLYPYLKAQSKFQEFDINIIFDKKFIGTAAGAVITSFIVVSGSFNSFLDRVIAQEPITYVAAFVSALGLGFTINWVGNEMLPGSNKDEKKLLQTKQADIRFQNLAQISSIKMLQQEEEKQQQEEEEKHEKEEEKDEEVFKGL